MRPCLRSLSAWRVPRPSRFSAASTVVSAMTASRGQNKKGTPRWRVFRRRPGSEKGYYSNPTGRRQGRAGGKTGRVHHKDTKSTKKKEKESVKETSGWPFPFALVSFFFVLFVSLW